MRCLVTGASRGLGAAILAALLESHAEIDQLYAGVRRKQTDDTPNRLHYLNLDVAKPADVETLKALPALDLIVNNAGIGFGNGFAATLAVNYHGTKAVCDALLDKMADGGRICNIASASGPMYVSALGDADERALLTAKVPSIDELDALALKYAGMTDYENSAYGLSKALVNAYTRALAAAHPRLTIVSVTPGFLATDLTKGMGATKPPSAGVPVVERALFDTDIVSGYFYGSDGLRSPIDRYRGPGTPEYVEED